MQTRRMEAEKKTLERKLNMERRSHEKVESVDVLQSNVGFSLSSNLNLTYLEHENKDLKQRCNQLESQLMEKESELTRLRVKDFSRYVTYFIFYFQIHYKRFYSDFF